MTSDPQISPTEHDHHSRCPLNEDNMDLDDHQGTCEWATAADDDDDSPCTCECVCEELEYADYIDAGESKWEAREDR